MRVTTEEIAGFVTIFMGAGWSLSFFLGRMVIKGLRDDMKKLIDGFANLQVKIPETYVTKHDCEVMIARHNCVTKESRTQ